MKRILPVSAALFFVLLACDEQNGGPTGEEQGPCYPNGTCNEGLVCASDLCVDLDGGTSDASETTDPDGDDGDSEEQDSSEPGSTSEPQESCEDQLQACVADGESCIYSYVGCAQARGDDACFAYSDACEMVESDPDCEPGSMAEAEFCSGDPDSTSGTSTTTGADPTAGGDDCPAPGCESYASKMNGCYPMLDIDWYAECLNHYDICGAWECLPGTAGHVACVNSSACDQIVDGACNQLDEQC